VKPGGHPGGATRYIGASVRRVEDPRLVSGQGRFLDDIRIDGLLHAAFLRSPHAHAVVRALDTSAAKSAPGVHRVLTGRDLASSVRPLSPRFEGAGFTSTAWPALARERVRFVGEPLAAVAAESAYAAVDARELIAVEYEPLRALAEVRAAMAAGAPRLHAGQASNTLFERRQSHGEVEAAFKGAAVVVRETFSHARCSAAPLEPRGLIAAWDGSGLTVWSGTQVPAVYGAALGRAFGLDDGRVRVIVPETGGGFGQKMHVMPEDLAVTALARATGRPIKWAETRSENLAAASHAREERVEIEAAADASGEILALRARLYSDAGAYHIHPLTAALEPLGTAAILPGPYRIPAYAFDLVAVATNKPPLGAYRGVGMTMGAFVMERTLDLVAERLGLDPAEIRRRNLIPRDGYPYTSAAGLVYDSGDYPKALEQALALAGYERLKRERDEARARGRLLGVGLSCYTEYTGIGAETYRRRGMVEIPGPEAATVTMAADGGVTCLLSFSSQGQGHATAAAQLIAEQLGVPLERVRVLQPDTATAPPGTGTFASRGAVVLQGAAGAAAVTLRKRLLDLAARVLEASATDLELSEGRVSVRGMPDRGVDLTEIAGAAGPASLEVTEIFDPPGPTFSGAVHVASVAVDPETGHVSVRDYVVVEDCGRVINPMIVEGQIHGAVAQGIGEALAERLVYDESGQLLTGTLMEYALPVAERLPFFTIGHLETLSPLTPGGSKGMGEGGTIGAPAAIANAVADAVKPLGLSVTALPILPERLVVLSPPGSADRAP